MKFLSQLGQAAEEYYAEPYMYDSGLYEATTNQQVSDAAVVGAAVFTLLFTLFLVAVSYVIYSFLLARIFKKAGIEQWKAWVPFYNMWIMLELGGQKGFWAVLSIVPFVNIVSLVFMYIAMYHIGLKMEKEGWFVLLAIFLPIVWLIWLAFDKSAWHGAMPAKAAAPATANGAPLAPASPPTPAKVSEPNEKEDSTPPATPPKVEG